MLKKLIIALRNQPQGTRDVVALTGAAVITAVVVSVWAWSPNISTDVVAGANSQTQTASPGFSKLFEGIGEQFSLIRESWSESSAELSAELETESDTPPISQVDELVVSEATPATEPKEVRIIVVESTSTATSTIEN
tara:strand:- start:486 stop:896 length:411 start_codon:yes stop_codon:yes gene_type:complete